MQQREFFDIPAPQIAVCHSNLKRLVLSCRFDDNKFQYSRHPKSHNTKPQLLSTPAIFHHHERPSILPLPPPTLGYLVHGSLDGLHRHRNLWLLLSVVLWTRLFVGKRQGVLCPPCADPTDLCSHFGPGNYYSSLPQDQRRTDQAGLCAGLFHLLFNVYHCTDWRARLEHGCSLGEIHGNHEDR